MTRDEIKTMLNLIAGAYNMFTRNKSEAEMKATINAWWLVLHPYEIQYAMQATQNYMTYGRFAPTPADILSEIIELKYPSAEDSLQKLINAAKLSIKEKVEAVPNKRDTFTSVSLAAEAYLELPPELQAYVKTPEGLKKFYRNWNFNGHKIANDFPKEIAKIEHQIECRKIKQVVIEGGYE